MNYLKGHTHMNHRMQPLFYFTFEEIRTLEDNAFSKVKKIVVELRSKPTGITSVQFIRPVEVTL